MTHHIVVRGKLAIKLEGGDNGCTLPPKASPSKGASNGLSENLYHYVEIKDWFSYPNLRDYYGPSNIYHIIHFIQLVNDLTMKKELMGRLVCVKSDVTDDQHHNAVFLIACYIMLNECYSPEATMSRLHKKVGHTIKPYVGENSGKKHSEGIQMIDCLRGLQRFIDLGLLSLDQVDLPEYKRLEDPYNGDMNWIVPGRFLALAGPQERVFPIEQFIEHCKKHGVKTIVRLNHECYDREKVKAAGLRHYDLFMKDGSIPTWRHVEQFLQICQQCTDGAIAVHCRAGLGRTGTMIAAHLMREYKISADETIAFLRIMRPGMVLTNQPQFLRFAQAVLHGSESTENMEQMILERFTDSVTMPQDILQDSDNEEGGEEEETGGDKEEEESDEKKGNDSNVKMANNDSDGEARLEKEEEGHSPSRSNSKRSLHQQRGLAKQGLAMASNNSAGATGGMHTGAFLNKPIPTLRSSDRQQKQQRL